MCQDKDYQKDYDKDQKDENPAEVTEVTEVTIEETETSEEEYMKKPEKNKSLKVLLEAVMLCIFAFIVLMTDFLGKQFGETAGNVALVVCALILVALFFWPSKKR